MAEVTLRGVGKRFGQHAAVAGMDLTIADGEFVVLLGPTGAGKTTTLRLIAGLEKPESGRVTIGGADVTDVMPAARDVTFVFQQYSLYPHLSVYENLAFPLRSPARRMEKGEIDRRVRATAKLVRIDHKLENRATKLSGGEMQRVAIGRALVRQPAIYLMDEPLSSLDAKLRAEMRLELKRIQQELGATLLYVTHDQTEAMTMADRIGILKDGRLIQIGTPRQIYTQPVTTYVASRLGQPAINLLPQGLLPDAGLPAGTATIGARTEHLTIEKASNGHADGVVDWIEHLGDQDHLHVRVGDRKLITLFPPDTPLAAGDKVMIRYHNPLCFDANGDRVEERAMIDEAQLRTLIDAVARTVADHAEELTALDSAIGDGDHGANMRRGFDAVAAEADSIAGKPLPDALKLIGTKLVMTVGGASGPLYGTLFLTLGKELAVTPDDYAGALRKAIDAVAARGKSAEGQKTMLDVLYPVAGAVASRLPAGEIVAVAHGAAAATRDVQATRGRASFLGERSIGHIDPGARSSALIVEAVVGALA